MPKQNGTITIRGTFDNKTYYRSNGKDYVKTKSALNKKRFDTDPAFDRSRKIAAQTKITAPLAAKVYHQLPKKLKKQGTIGKMIGEAGRLLRAGHSEQEIINRLFAKFNR